MSIGQTNSIQSLDNDVNIAYDDANSFGNNLSQSQQFEIPASIEDILESGSFEAAASQGNLTDWYIQFLKLAIQELSAQGHPVYDVDDLVDFMLEADTRIGELAPGLSVIYPQEQAEVLGDMLAAIAEGDVSGLGDLIENLGGAADNAMEFAEELSLATGLTLSSLTNGAQLTSPKASEAISKGFENVLAGLNMLSPNAYSTVSMQLS